MLITRRSETGRVIWRIDVCGWLAEIVVCSTGLLFILGPAFELLGSGRAASKLGWREFDVLIFRLQMVDPFEGQEVSTASAFWIS